MKRWIVYTMMLWILVAIARATEDFRHILYEGERKIDQMCRKKYIPSMIPVDFWGFIARRVSILFDIFELGS